MGENPDLSLNEDKDVDIEDKDIDTSTQSTKREGKDVDMDMKSPKRRCFDSPCSTAASTPVMTATSPEARAKARHSTFATLSVRQLKERIKLLGGDFTGLSEKTELVAYLEMLDTLRIEPGVVPPIE